MLQVSAKTKPMFRRGDESSTSSDSEESVDCKQNEEHMQKCRQVARKYHTLAVVRKRDSLHDDNRNHDEIQERKQFQQHINIVRFCFTLMLLALSIIINEYSLLQSTNIVVYIQMELCYTTLRQVLNTWNEQARLLLRKRANGRCILFYFILRKSQTH
jgi:hypothetical protein